jgi:hypothetical protein
MNKAKLLAHKGTTIAQLQSMFYVDSENGWLLRAVPWVAGKMVRKPAGTRAGTPTGNGYRKVQVAGKFHHEHRIIFALTHGHWPSGVVDHINGDTLDNRPSNLRDLTVSENTQHRVNIKSRSHSGIVGAWFLPKKGVYISVIRHGGKWFHLGTFKTPIEAHECYVQAKRKMQPEINTL